MTCHHIIRYVGPSGDKRWKVEAQVITGNDITDISKEFDTPHEAGNFIAGWLGLDTEGCHEIHTRK